ncbi:MAG: hypothetical protein KME46_16575 [Brasilonema angustatum HA4187-MV1]|nr:hypothetical protein [Brasilonema angustatum HA4187-MV1]
MTYSYTYCKQYSLGFSANPAIASEALSFALNPRNALPQIRFLTLNPTNFTVLDEVLAYLRYRTNQLVICINQDVPTYFSAVQRSRLPIITMLLDRGLSDTIRVKQTIYIVANKHRDWEFRAKRAASLTSTPLPR